MHQNWAEIYFGIINSRPTIARHSELSSPIFDLKFLLGLKTHFIFTDNYLRLAMLSHVVWVYFCVSCVGKSEEQKLKNVYIWSCDKLVHNWSVLKWMCRYSFTSAKKHTCFITHIISRMSKYLPSIYYMFGYEMDTACNIA